MLDTCTLHHVSLPVSDIDKARKFYGDVLGLEEDMRRPDFEFKGAWYKLGDRHVHLIVPSATERPTLRLGKAIDLHDAHLAIRVRSFSGAIAHLESRGYRRTDERNAEPSADNPLPMRINSAGKAGFPRSMFWTPIEM